MAHLPPIVSDLAMILLVAGIDFAGSGHYYHFI